MRIAQISRKTAPRQAVEKPKGRGLAARACDEKALGSEKRHRWLKEGNGLECGAELPEGWDSWWPQKQPPITESDARGTRPDSPPGPSQKQAPSSGDRYWSYYHRKAGGGWTGERRALSCCCCCC